MPAARRFIVEHRLNETFAGRRDDLGIIVPGGLYNSLVRALEQHGLADAFGDALVPVLALNVVCPLVPDEIRGFCAGKRSVLVIEEGHPEFIEQEVLATLRRLDVDCRIHGKDLLPMAGEYTVEVIGRGLTDFFAAEAPGLPLDTGRNWLAETDARRQAVADELAQPLPARPPQFCTGCPERPVFAALKLVQQDLGPVHIAADIGCHSFATLEPFSMGHSILGYGMSLASRAGVSPMFARRTLAVMGDGGFWHNGLLSGVQSALFNGDDAVLLILKNGYTSATGTQEIISSPSEAQKADARDPQASAVHANRSIERTLAGIGVKWLREIDSYDVAAVRRTLDEAFTTDFAGLKVIIAEGECQLERQRRVRPWRSARLKAGKRSVRVKYGVDEDTCSGDHSCIRLSGCPTLTLKASPDPLKVDPVATVIDGCVGCGLCGENAHAAALCPSFYRGEVIQNPNWRDRFAAWVRATVIADCAGRMSQRPITILIAALGGQGGGVLAEWLVDVALNAGYPAQSTSIPGVAQRTGATTYYVEVYPEPHATLGARRPILSLLPVPGGIDLMVASELLEAVRMVQGGMVSAERTTLVTSSCRTLTTVEKMVPGDGRFDPDRLLAVARRHSRRLVTFDMDDAARAAGTAVSSVMFGAIAASGALPFGREAFEGAIRDSGLAVAASLAGFARGWDAMKAIPAAVEPPPAAQPDVRAPGAPVPPAVAAALPAITHDMAGEGYRRLVEFQDLDYAGLYLERLQRILAAERAADPRDEHACALTRETARFLALWMAFDDIVRVADLKCRASRFARVRREVGAGDRDVVRIVDYLKPGVPEIAALLPAAPARWVSAWDRRRIARGKNAFAVALTVRANGIFGFLALRTLSSLTWLRRRGTRYAQEQAMIERWLAAIAAALESDWEVANEIALCGRLVKGYGATNERAKRNLLHILDHLATGGSFAAPALRADAIRQARDAALADEDGRGLDAALVTHGAPPRPIVPQPIRWMKKPADPATVSR